MLSYLRALFLIDPLIIFLTAVMGTLSLAASTIDSTGVLPHQVARLWARMLLFISGVTVRVEGLEKISERASYVIAANHLSFMDTPVVLAHIPLQFRFLAKKGLFKVPFIGHHLHRAGHVPIPREDARGSLKAMSEAARLIAERGVSVLIFPEGGRSPEGLQPFREGAAYIAIKAGVPLVPAAITGTREILPMGSIHVRPGPVSLRIGDPIPTAGLTLRDRGRLTREAEGEVSRLLSVYSENRG